MPERAPDGAPRSQRSLFGDILDWMLVPLLLLWPLSVLIIWVVAQGIANRPFDRELGELTRTLSLRVTVQAADVTGRTPEVRVGLEDAAAALLRSDTSDAVFFQVLGARGEWVAGDRDLPVPQEAPAQAGELRFRDDAVQGREVRVAYLWLPTPQRGGGAAPLVQVAETLEKRAQLTTEIARGVMLSQFAILPLAVLLVWFALLRGFQPLNELQRRIRQRASDDLSPLDERLAPEEVSPLVGAINDLLARLDRSIGAQKHFLADAAHQLKTPLAGLRTQAELAQREVDAGGDAKSVKRSLHQIARSSQRAAHMVNQLLSMARAEDSEQARRAHPFNLAALATETVRDFVPRSLELGIDLGYEGPEPGDERGVRPSGQPVLIREAIRNLVDNALQYTPRGGTVTVRLLADPFGQVAVLQVEDNGPGIPEAERELVFQPFYRTLGTDVDGSGLGLAIVREIAERHGGSVSIESAQERSQSPGTRVTMRLPLQPPGLR
ncbi:MAG: sensor histidine kinase N-terminal domain-containing protein [Pseudomonadota bacterium]